MEDDPGLEDEDGGELLGEFGRGCVISPYFFFPPFFFLERVLGWLLVGLRQEGCSRRFWLGS
jgi:hypothetical protein